MVTPCAALELACGEGSDALHLARQGFDVLATEWVPAALEITERRAADEGLAIRTLLVDATSMELRERFQFIYMGYIPLSPTNLEDCASKLPPSKTSITPNNVEERNWKMPRTW